MANLSSYAAGILPVATARLPVVVLGLGLVSIVSTSERYSRGSDWG